MSEDQSRRDKENEQAKLSLGHGPQVLIAEAGPRKEIELRNFEVKLGNVRYFVEPGSAVRIIGAETYTITVYATMQVKDRQTGADTKLTFDTKVTGVTDETRVVNIRDALLEMLGHEIDECLFENGQRVKDPHER